MELIKTKNTLKRLSERSEKKGYSGDASSYAFQRHTLILLEKMIKEIKGFEKQLKYMWQSLDELKENKK